ncbi:hypothetical protein [Candidatus Nitrosocosmicus franklandus]|uniref:Uncharacterized protein n=1 Tax=Candidatus Nitrosocosmicus franklandianus TaxID=1798806 RepID=A0A484I733_9ARCH|nr:hypothetical protein [Candidatus Nitrosocosmicus franklandus]VFJ13539.1 protein of unknown function [Candidatus Nitrosocosmicus franklandus]
MKRIRPQANQSTLTLNNLTDAFKSSTYFHGDDKNPFSKIGIRIVVG